MEKKEEDEEEEEEGEKSCSFSCEILERSDSISATQGDYKQTVTVSLVIG